MSLTRMFDAAFPPDFAPPGCAAVAGYIGGARATNVWTAAEWQRFSHLRQIPVWVPPIGDPVSAHAEAIDAADAARVLGWAAHLPSPDTRVIVGDLETGHDAAWWDQFALTLAGQGFTAVAYGSLSTIAANLASDLWVASWDGAARLEAGQTIRAHQYASGPSVDLSVIDEWMLARGGVGPRRG